MARTLYFLDGSREVLLREDDEKFAEILEERLGKDVAEYFKEFTENLSEIPDSRAYQDGYDEGYDEGYALLS